MKNRKVEQVVKVEKAEQGSKKKPCSTCTTCTTFTTFCRGFTLIKHSEVSSKGFTLIELLVVITILGILSSIGLGNFINSQTKGRDTQRKSDLKQIQNSLELYYGDKGRYPQADASGRILGCPSEPNPVSCDWGEGPFSDGKTTYLGVSPKDPKGGISYVYKASSDGSKYQIFAHLENDNDQDIISGITTDCGAEKCNFGLTSSNANLTEGL